MVEPDEEVIRTVVGKHPVIIHVRYKPFTDDVKRRLVDLIMPMMDDILLEMKKSEEAETAIRTCADQPDLSNSSEEAALVPPKKKRNRKDSAKKE